MRARLLTTQAAAARVHVSTGTVRSWASRGHLHPVIVVGRRPLYAERDVLIAERSTRRGKVRPTWRDLLEASP